MAPQMPMYAQVVAEEKQNLKVRLKPAIKTAWDELLERKKISQQDAGTSLIQWILDQDDVLQSMVLGQVKPAPDLARVIAQRLAEKPPFHVIRKGKVAAVQNAGGEARQLSNEGRGGSASRAPTRG
jgi:DUF917 family protein